MTHEERADLIQQAMDILGRRADRDRVERAFDGVLRDTKKEDWNESLRYLHDVTAKERNASRKAIAGLRRAIAALTLVASRLEIKTDHPIEDAVASLEALRQQLQPVADSPVRAGSPFDARKRWAVRGAAELLKEVDKPLTTSRHGDFERLSAILCGDPDADFQEFVIEYLDQRVQSD
jgi:hypothetical protein